MARYHRQVAFLTASALAIAVSLSHAAEQNYFRWNGASILNAPQSYTPPDGYTPPTPSTQNNPTTYPTEIDPTGNATLKFGQNTSAETWGIVNGPMSINLTTEGQKGKVTWMQPAGLPSGLTFSNGIISGIPTAPFDGLVQVSANDTDTTSTISVKIHIEQAVVLFKDNIWTVRKGQPFTGEIATNVKGSGFTLSGATWLNVISPRKFSGTAPNVAGTYPLTATLFRPGTGITATATQTLRVLDSLDLNLSQTSLAPKKDDVISVTASLSGAAANAGLVTILNMGDATARGLTWNAATGVLSGPISAGPALTLAFEGKDTAAGDRIVKSLSIAEIASAAPTVTAAVPQVVRNGEPVNFTVTSNIPNPTYAFVGTKPTGWTINPTTGVVTGPAPTVSSPTPTSVSISATGPKGQTATSTQTFTAAPAPAVALASSGGTWSGGGGSSGSGTGGSGGGAPTASVGIATSYPVTTTTVVNGVATPTTSYVLNSSTPVATTGSGATAKAGLPVSVTPSTANLVGTPTFSLSGTTPAALAACGLSFNATTGVISGVTRNCSGVTGQVVATDSADGKTSVTNFTVLEMNATIAGVLGSYTRYGATVTGNASSNLYQPVFSAAGLPSWLSINATTGALQGTAPTLGGNSQFYGPFTLRATSGADSNLWYETSVDGVTVYPNLDVSTSKLAQNIRINTPMIPMNPNFTGLMNTNAPLVLQMNVVPPGVTISNRTVSGTPTKAGRFSTWLILTDSDGATKWIDMDLVVTDNPVISTTLSGLTAASGASYSLTLASSNILGTASYTSTTLPAGLSLSTSGVLSGTPTTAGSYSGTITVTDSFDGKKSQSNWTMTVAPPKTTNALISEMEIGNTTVVSQLTSSLGNNAEWNVCGNSFAFTADCDQYNSYLVVSKLSNGVTIGTYINMSSTNFRTIGGWIFNAELFYFTTTTNRIGLYTANGSSNPLGIVTNNGQTLDGYSFNPFYYGGNYCWVKNGAWLTGWNLCDGGSLNTTYTPDSKIYGRNAKKL